MSKIYVWAINLRNNTVGGGGGQVNHLLRVTYFGCLLLTGGAQNMLRPTIHLVTPPPPPRPHMLRFTFSDSFVFDTFFFDTYIFDIYIFDTYFFDPFFDPFFWPLFLTPIFLTFVFLHVFFDTYSIFIPPIFWPVFWHLCCWHTIFRHHNFWHQHFDNCFLLLRKRLKDVSEKTDLTPILLHFWWKGAFTSDLKIEILRKPRTQNGHFLPRLPPKF